MPEWRAISQTPGSLDDDYASWQEDVQRPHTLEELAQQAVVSFEPRVSLNAYLRSCEALLKQAHMLYDESDLETACILLIRVAKLTIEDLPNRHPQYRQVESAKRKRLQLAGQDALDLLSIVKSRVSDQYEAWRRDYESGRAGPVQPAEIPASQSHKPLKASNKLVRKSRANTRHEDSSVSSSSSKDPSPVAGRSSTTSYRSSQTDLVSLPDRYTTDSHSTRSASPSPSHPIATPIYARSQERPSDMERRIDELAFEFQGAGIAQPLRPRETPIPPHLLSTGASASRNKSAEKRPAYPNLANGHVDRMMSTHQRQQGYADHAAAMAARTAISYPSLETRPQPRLWRAPSLLSVPRPPRPPKTKPGMGSIPASQLGRAMTEAGDPLRDLLCPSDLIDTFVALAAPATTRNCETCGLLLGTLEDDIFTVKVLLLPKQKGTSDTCETIDEEGIFNFQDARDLQTLAWIHTHPRQTCFLSSLDLHTHYGNQRMLAESVAIVCAPSCNPSTGIFRLTDPPGLDIIENCRQPGAFHPHPREPIYTDAGVEDAGHFHLVNGLSLEVHDMR